MADTKITALTAIGANPINVATFPIPMVDLLDNSMAASGTTKKVTVNQILGAGGTATLASATITGDLTVDTSTLKVDSANNVVGITNASPITGTDGGLTVGTIGSSKAIAVSMFNCFARLRERDAINNFAITTNIDTTNAVLDDNTRTSWKVRFGSGNDNFLIQRAAIGSTTFQDLYSVSTTSAVWSDGAGGTRMTLNATGLGVGTSPSQKLDIIGSLATRAATTGANQDVVSLRALNSDASAYANALYYANSQKWHYAGASLGMTLDSSGNLGIGVASPTSQLTVGSGGTANPAATVAFHKSTSDEYRLKLTSSTFNAAGKWIGLGLGYSSDYMKMAIIAEAKDTNARGNLYFALNNDATSANASIADAKMTLKSTGQVRFVPLAADPSGAEAGDVYYNSTSNKLKCYNGTTWNDLF